MTGIKDKNQGLFEMYAAKLRSKGYDVVSPAEMDAVFTPPTWEECMRRDIKELMGCDVVVTLPGWEKSRGARLEAFVAREVGIKVIDADVLLRRKG